MNGISKRRTRRAFMNSIVLTLVLSLIMTIPAVSSNGTLTITFDREPCIKGEVSTIQFSSTPNTPILIEIRDSTNNVVFAWEDTTNSSGIFILYLKMTFSTGDYVLYAKVGTISSSKSF